MGAKSSNLANSKQNPFKLFEYQCPNCKSKRPIQYFYKNGTFLAQAPRVVCGECSNSVTVEPFKTVDYSCPSCKKMQKVRLPARPVPLNTYNLTRAKCGCGFSGEVAVGRTMDVACERCWEHKREMREVWTEDGDEVRTFCDTCKEYQRGIARAPKKKGAENCDPEYEYTCGDCKLTQPIGTENLLRYQGLVSCANCNWVGYPEIWPKGGSGKAMSKKMKARLAGSAAARSASSRRQLQLPQGSDRGGTTGSSSHSLTAVVPFAGADP
jgi:hypothetical protein